MKINSILLFLTIVMTLHIGCKSGTDENVEVEPQVPVVDTNFYEVSVNNLRMRDAPDLTSNTRLMLPEGALVKYWNEHSSEKISVTLRGGQVTDYWFKIKYGKETGWVFAGALTKLAKDENSDQLIVPGQRVGPVEATDSEQSIIDKIGGALVQRGEFVVGEGVSVIATYLYPASQDELILLWDEEDFTTLREIRIRKAGSKWKLTNGIQIGSKLQEVEKANGGSFLLSGFEWDYAGTTINWQGGSMPDNITLIFAAPSKIHKALIGDHSISSTESHMAKANPRVSTIRVLF